MHKAHTPPGIPPVAWWVHWVTLLGETAAKFKIQPLNLTFESIEAAARRQSGLSVSVDDEFRAEMRLLLDSLLRDSDLTIIGRYSVRYELKRRLANRLRVQHELRQHPEIGKLPVRRPIFIVGLPRTGTTLLHRLLMLDNETRAPLLWELLAPYPLNEAPSKIEARIRHAERLMWFTFAAAPALHTIHHMEAREPEECVFLLPHSLYYHLRTRIPTYHDWYVRRNVIPDYEYFKQQLQMLQWCQPERYWVLKSPFHLWNLDALLAVFPDARIIQMHRDPKKVLASWCSFASVFMRLQNRHVDLHQLGQDWLEMWKEGMTRAMQVRDSTDSSNFFDVHYHELLADPMGIVEKIYGHFGDELTADTRSRVQDYVRQNGQSKQGTHQYSLGTFGLEEAAVNATFEDYAARYGVQVE